MTPPHVTAAVDQARAEYDTELDRLTSGYRELVTRRGRDQALCDFTAYLQDSDKHTPTVLAGLVALTVEQRAGDR
jgi:hypothetical protein